MDFGGLFSQQTWKGIPSSHRLGYFPKVGISRIPRARKQINSQREYRIKCSWIKQLKMSKIYQSRIKTDYILLFDRFGVSAGNAIGNIRAEDSFESNCAYAYTNPIARVPAAGYLWIEARHLWQSIGHQRKYIVHIHSQAIWMYGVSVQNILHQTKKHRYKCMY